MSEELPAYQHHVDEVPALLNLEFAWQLTLGGLIRKHVLVQAAAMDLSTSHWRVASATVARLPSPTHTLQGTQ
ncbi:MAG: hypothetical protein FRX49_05351 [Trebouxia sp. A1-2]|nr:MAG: hypothetical protein FRX49_05351 [Trebouxia sp. A1-2]